MEKIKRLIFFSLLVIGAGACSKQGQKPTPPPPPPVYPAAATLLSPADGQPCLTGTSVSSVESTVTFSWDKAANTDSYELHIRNLVSNQTEVHTTTGISADVNLLKSTPYEWYVISLESSSSSHSQSDTWRFFNSGPGITVYPPYPAQPVYPVNGAELVSPSLYNTITLQWNATQGNEPILNYDVYYGTDPSPPLLQAGVTVNNLPSVPYTDYTTYYWKIVARDANGNTSTSQVFTFYIF